MFKIKNRSVKYHKVGVNKSVYSLSIPTEWAEYLGFSIDDSNGEIILENDKIIIKKKGGVQVG